MTDKTQELPEMTVAGFIHEDGFEQISHTWDELMDWMKENPDVIPPDATFLSVLDVASDVPRALVGYVVQDSTAHPDLFLERIPAAQYKEYIYTGPYTGLQGAWQSFRESLDPNQIAAGPLLEIHLNKPSDTSPDELQTGLYIPVREN